VIYHGEKAIPYGRGSFCDLGEHVLQAIRSFEKRPDILKAKPVLVGTGISGASLVFPVALALGLDCAILRKESESSHGEAGSFEGVLLCGRKCVFVDDFVSGGLTKTRVSLAVKRDKGTMPWQYTSREDLLCDA